MNFAGHVETARLVRAVRWVALTVAVLAAVRAVILFRLPARPGLLPNPVFWLAVGVVAFGAATTSWIPTVSDALAPPGRRWLLAAAVACGGAAVIAYTFSLLPRGVLVAAWLLAQPLWVAAFLPRSIRLRRPSRAAVGEAIGIGTVLVVAAASRLFNTSRLPVNFHGDFASFGLQARALLAGQYTDVFGTGWAGLPLPTIWPTAIMLRLVGDNRTGLAAFAALGGLASIVALYLMTRELFSRRPALFAAALLAGDITHIHYSRVPVYMDPVPFVAWSLCLGVFGLRRGKRWYFALSGILAGYAFLSYYPGRIVVPLWALAVVLTAIAVPRLLRARSGGLVIAVIGFLIVIGPTTVFFARHPEIVNDRTRAVLIFNPDVWHHTAAKHGLAVSDVRGVFAEQVRRSAEGFWRFNDSATQFNLERNMLEPIAGILLILGIGYAVSHPRSTPLLFVVGWGLGYVLAGALTVDPPFSGRIVGLTLPIAILGGLALDRILRLLPRGRFWAPVGLGVGLLVAILSAARNWHDYVAWGSDPRTARPPVHIARFLQAQPLKYQVRLASRDISWKIRELQFLLPDRAGDSLNVEEISKGVIAWPDRPTIFILTPEFRSLAEALRVHYPNGRLIDGSPTPMKGLFWAFLTE